jgi:hypothetical protein
MLVGRFKDQLIKLLVQKSYQDVTVEWMLMGKYLILHCIFFKMKSATQCRIYIYGSNKFVLAINDSHK